MTLIPKKVQYLILAAFLIFLIAILVRHKILAFDVQDLVVMGQGGFAEVFVTTRSKNYPIDPKHTPKLLRVISEMNPQLWTGWKGEAWEDYCSLSFRKGDNNILYAFSLSTRNSMEGDILARLQRKTGSSTYYYTGYNGNELVEFLNEITHNLCIKSGSR